MTYRCLIAIVLLNAFALPTHAAAETCPKGYGSLNVGEPCIPRSLLNYLYCLSKSGGGRIEVVQNSNNSASHSSEISIDGHGSGIVLSGGAGGTYKQADTARAAKELRENLDSSLAANCKFLATKFENGESATNSGKKAAALNGLTEAARPVTSPASGISAPELESVDFLFDQAEITARSQAYLHDLSKRLAEHRDSQITLIPEFGTLQQSEADEANGEQSLALRRQLAIRSVLASSGYPSDQIVFERGQARIVGTNRRYDNTERRIESGMMIQSWP